jgi:hypothetical protein
VACIVKLWSSLVRLPIRPEQSNLVYNNVLSLASAYAFVGGPTMKALGFDLLIHRLVASIQRNYCLQYSCIL